MYGYENYFKSIHSNQIIQKYFHGFQDHVLTKGKNICWKYLSRLLLQISAKITELNNYDTEYFNLQRHSKFLQIM